MRAHISIENDDKLYEYFKAHIESGWSISLFLKYLRAKDRPIFQMIKKSDQRFIDLVYKYKKSKSRKKNY